ncbi:nicotinate phosphoribosyltransferase [Seinonella peptonophila]|uniref:Nicotinate phosphoribosyltransferase n=1 Tax=Seinonella peptonophila TaxID=112248 RepID=A0A1M4ZG57_9BACL|nr:nicotinate phosphoribosyltransferase [Seinonella peptonophila]SHF16777.1 nicotinate phosphoribosyltransferase [Seinonella peptonophila]
MISALHTDKYQITMTYAHWKNGTANHRRIFDLYFRKLPFGNGFAVFAGLERAIDYLENLRFSDEDINFLRSLNDEFDEEFFDFLRQFRFQGNVDAIPEGSLIFPNEPLLRLEGNVVELQLVETALLNFIGFQTLIATKAARIRHLTDGELLLEFGTRRAQEMDAAIWGARATYIGGFDATSNLLAGKQFGIPTSGTHSHAWVQDFHSELEAFRAYAKAFPDSCTLLVDTYDTLRSGVPNAIKVAKELQAIGKNLSGIRLDSGDLAYFSKQSRQMLDQAGLTQTKIIASSDLDENTILNLKAQGAQIDGWGIGTKLITSYNQPALGAVYKMVARFEQGNWKPTIKLSSNPEKITTPGKKTVYRIIDQQTQKAHADLITESDETIDEKKALTLFHPIQTFKRKRVQNFSAVPLLVPIFKQGKRIYSLPTLQEIRQFHDQQLTHFWDEYLRTLNPEEYPIDLSQKLWDTKHQMLESIHREVKDRE